MKRITVLLAVLAASFTALLVAPAIASAGCTAGWDAGSIPLWAEANGFFQHGFVIDGHHGWAQCTSTNGNQYQTQVLAEEYLLGHWQITRQQQEYGPTFTNNIVNRRYYFAPPGGWTYILCDNVFYQAPKVRYSLTVYNLTTGSSSLSVTTSANKPVDGSCGYFT